MTMLYVWKCPRLECGREVLLPPQILPEITSDLVRSSMVEPYVDFVCPECGTGIRRFQHDIPQGEFHNLDRYKPVLFHAFLRCDDPHCAGRGVVHTLADTDSPTESPKIPVNRWKLEGIDCHEGHRLKEPKQLSDLKGWTVT